MSLHIAALRERGHKIFVGGDEYDLSDLDNILLRNEIFQKLKNNNFTEFPKVSTDVEDSTEWPMSTSTKMHKDLAPLSVKVHSVCLLVLPTIQTTNIEILKIWSIDYN